MIRAAVRAQASPLIDATLFKKFREAFGGRLRFIVSGGAPLATHIEEYLACALCCPVFQVCPWSGLTRPREGGEPGAERPACALCRCRLSGVHFVLVT